MKKEMFLAIFSLSMFIGLTYLISSWWIWSLGCSYGNRGFVEYYTLLSLPFGYSLLQIKSIKSIILRSILIFLIVAFVILNLKIIYAFDGCWYGDDWSWNLFVDYITTPI
ncbi:hypothetical protein ACFLQ5_02465 [Bacteroidota bacterium]